jgi:hypothetical protein
MTTTNYLLISYILSYNLVIRVTLIRIIVIRSTRIRSKETVYNIDFHFAFIYFIRHRAKMHIL